MKRRTLCHGAGPAWHHGERRGARLRPHRGRGAADWQGTEERLAARAMMGRIGEPEDIANAVALGVGLVLDCTGRATERSGAQAHLENLSDPKGSPARGRGRL